MMDWVGLDWELGMSDVKCSRREGGYHHRRYRREGYGKSTAADDEFLSFGVFYLPTQGIYGT